MLAAWQNTYNIRRKYSGRQRLAQAPFCILARPLLLAANHTSNALGMMGIVEELYLRTKDAGRVLFSGIMHGAECNSCHRRPSGERTTPTTPPCSRWRKASPAGPATTAQRRSASPTAASNVIKCENDFFCGQIFASVAVKWICS